MIWIYANSSTIDKFRYDSSTQTLEIEFKNGSVYQYFDVPENVFQEFSQLVNSGESAGKFFTSRIRGYYRYARV